MADPAALGGEAEQGLHDREGDQFGVAQPGCDADLGPPRRQTLRSLQLTCDPDLVRDFWLYAYAPEVLDTEARRCPVVSDLTGTLGGHTTVSRVPIPVDRTDGFNEAYYARPEMLLDPGARQACSA
ncbi:hypothetical protein ACFP3U_18600 [Kitasatospora misakiensis]|uniref:Uncharacterized protein n=1 Tax=Kitasatospora misakiensis TaxID=67330 RepID=A0ABW0X7H0_9ACTN